VNADMRFQFFARLRSATPVPKTELNYQSNFQLLIAVILSAQATDVSVNKATKALFSVAPDAKKMVALKEQKLKLAEYFVKNMVE
jgi:endonuclease-3